MVNETDDFNHKYYEIRLKGYLDERRINHFEGLQATFLPNGETRLTGLIIDQAALHGILARIRDMNVPLLAVRCLDDFED